MGWTNERIKKIVDIVYQEKLSRRLNFLTKYNNNETTVNSKLINSIGKKDFELIEKTKELILFCIQNNIFNVIEIKFSYINTNNRIISSLEDLTEYKMDLLLYYIEHENHPYFTKIDIEKYITNFSNTIDSESEFADDELLESAINFFN